MLFTSLLLVLACATADKADSGKPATEPGTVELGGVCPIGEKVGEITVWASGPDANVSGRVYDRADPWVGAPEAETDTCAFYQFTPDSCGDCAEGTVCAVDGACVPERRVQPVTLDVTADGETTTFVSDATTGDVFGTAGPTDAAYDLRLDIAGEVVEIPAMKVADMLADVVVAGEGDSMAPGALSITWTPPADGGGRVRTRIPINHHAAGPTFTLCQAEASTGAMSATAAMLTPLAVVTGIEFQGVEHANTAAVWVTAGCVDVRFGVGLDTGGVDWANE